MDFGSSLRDNDKVYGWSSTHRRCPGPYKYVRKRLRIGSLGFSQTIGAPPVTKEYTHEEISDKISRREQKLAIDFRASGSLGYR